MNSFWYKFLNILSKAVPAILFLVYFVCGYFGAELDINKYVGSSFVLILVIELSRFFFISERENLSGYQYFGYNYWFHLKEVIWPMAFLTFFIIFKSNDSRDLGLSSFYILLLIIPILKVLEELLKVKRGHYFIAFSETKIFGAEKKQYDFSLSSVKYVLKNSENNYKIRLEDSDEFVYVILSRIRKSQRPTLKNCMEELVTKYPYNSDYVK